MTTTPYVDPQTIHNPAAGGKPPATWGDTIRDDLEFLIAPPMVKAQRTTNQTAITTGTWVAVQFNAADIWDSDAFHDTATNNTRITVPSGLGGRYHIEGNVGWDTSTAGAYRQATLRVNGTTHISTVLSSPASYCRQYLAATVDLAAGSYVELLVGHDSGGDRTLVYDGYGLIWLSARWVSR